MSSNKMALIFSAHKEISLSPPFNCKKLGDLIYSKKPRIFLHFRVSLFLFSIFIQTSGNIIHMHLDLDADCHIYVYICKTDRALCS